jgi:DNA repair exonuclease SbcCD nuclease subunit
MPLDTPNEQENADEIDVVELYPELEEEDEELRRVRLEQEEKEKKERMEKREKQRTHVLREILSTEQTYVDWLKVLDQEFMKPLKASMDRGGDALLAPNEYQNMFMDIGLLFLTFF